MKAPSRFSSTPTKRSDSRNARESKRHWSKATVLRELSGLADRKVRAKMAYFGVVVPKAHGISAPVLHRLARHIGKDHRLAQQLWISGIHEARILAALIGESDKVTAAEMDRWARDFDSWDLVDSACCYLYSGSKLAWKKAAAWSRRREEFIKRGGFSLAAYLSYKDKTAPDARFIALLRIIEREAHDERKFVKKAVNWALRNIGKRNRRLNREAIRCAQRIRAQGSSPARWIAADALRELQSPEVQRRIQRKTS